MDFGYADSIIEDFPQLASGVLRVEGINSAGDPVAPEPGEVIFADAAGRAHARRWVNKQSAYSAVRAETTEVLIVAEALHDTAAADIGELTAAMVEAVTATWPATATVERAG